MSKLQNYLKFGFRIEKKQAIGNKITNGLRKISGLNTPKIEKDCSHSYYVYPLTLDNKIIKTSREKIIYALEKEGVKGLFGGYANIHLLPMFQKKIAYGKNGFPWNHVSSRKNIKYEKGICPVAEELNDKTFFGIELCLYDYDEKNINELINAFSKVFKNLDKVEKVKLNEFQ